MTNLYDFLVQLFYQLANAFFYPIAFALLILFAYSLIDLGALFYSIWQRRREQSEIDISELARILAGHLKTDIKENAIPKTAVFNRPLARFWNRVESKLVQLDTTEDVDIWLDEALRNEENDLKTKLDRSLAMVRIGPMLGLAGTIIPLGPALKSLLGGNMAGMVDHLVVGFGAVVCGLVLSGIAYFITLVRERWARNEIKEMEDFCELLMRNIEKQKRANLVPISENNHHQTEESIYAVVR
jgi:biopolymer transport protein ExbB/TolQ